ncbi:MAG: ABC transporter ATP-binding protein [Bacteroidota bacterium]
MTTTLTPVKRFWRMLKPDKTEIRNVYIYAIFNGLIGLSLPLGIQAIVNLIQGGQINSSWVILVSIVLLGIAFSGVLQIYQMYIVENLQQKIFSRAAFEFAYRVPRIRMETLYKHYAPELMNRFFDTISLQKGMSKILIDFSTAAIQLIFGLLLLSFYHSFFILFSVALILLVYVIFLFLGRRGLDTSLDESKYKYKVAHWLEELARTNMTFKLAGRTDLHLERTDQEVGNYLAARNKHFRIVVNQFGWMIAFKVLMAMGLLAIGGILVMQQQMNIGQFVAAEIIILLIMGSVEKMIMSLETIYDVLTSLEKIGQVTDMNMEKREGIELLDACDDGGIEITLEKVAFAYPDYPRNTLSDLDLRIGPGEKVLVAGPNGAGKSTLLQVIAGLYDVKTGNVSYNGLPKGNLTMTSLRDLTGDYMSDEQIFQGTILENIGIGREAANFENVQWAAKAMGLENFIRTQPKGYDSMLDPLGKKLSRGIIQRLLLARSIAHRPRILLLENALEQLDIIERKKIIDFLTDSANPWTLIAVSSDPYFAQKLDRILIMEDGRIVDDNADNQFSQSAPLSV